MKEQIDAKKAYQEVETQAKSPLYKKSENVRVSRKAMRSVEKISQERIHNL